jgi:hypothetical protein
MNMDRGPHTGQVPLPGFTEPATAPGETSPPKPGEAGAAAPTVRTRNEGIRRLRRMSNWTAAALVVGTGATTAALVHNAVPISGPAAVSTFTTTTGVGPSAGTHGTRGPQVSHTVATTTASGVTVTTTSHVVNGKTVVTRVRHVPAHHDS